MPGHRPSAILDVKKLNFFTIDRVEMGKMRKHAKFREDWFNRCQDTVI